MHKEVIFNSQTENLEGSVFTFSSDNNIDQHKKKIASEKIFQLKGKISFSLSAGNFYIIKNLPEPVNLILSEYPEIKVFDIKLYHSSNLFI